MFALRSQLLLPFAFGEHRDGHGQGHGDDRKMPEHLGGNDFRRFVARHDRTIERRPLRNGKPLPDKIIHQSLSGNAV